MSEILTEPQVSQALDEHIEDEVLSPYLDAHSSLNEFGVDEAIRTVLEENAEMFQDVTLELLPKVKKKSLATGQYRELGDALLIRFQKKELQPNITVAKGVIVERNGDLLDVKYLDSSSRPENFHDLSEDEKNHIEASGVTMGGWRRLVSGSHELFKAPETLPGWISAAAKRSRPYFIDVPEEGPRRKSAEFEYNFHDDMHLLHFKSIGGEPLQ